MKNISIKLPDQEEQMLQSLKENYTKYNKGIKFTNQLIIRLAIIHEYERQQKNR